MWGCGVRINRGCGPGSCCFQKPDSAIYLKCCASTISRYGARTGKSAVVPNASTKPCRDSNHAELKIVINELVILLAEMPESRNPDPELTLPDSERTVWLFLENLKHRIDEPWTLDSMAEACGLGRTHFSSYCRKAANIPPVEFLTRCRLVTASHLLLDHPVMSGTEIACRCGFQSSQYFARVFHARLGHSPSGHRKSNSRRTCDP